MPRKAHGVIFDMDGLIVDTAPLYRDAVMAAADGGHDMPLTFYLSIIELSGETTRAVFNERFGKGFDFDSFWRRASKRFWELAASQLSLKMVSSNCSTSWTIFDCPEPSPLRRSTKTCGIILTPMACSIDSKPSSLTATTRVILR